MLSSGPSRTLPLARPRPATPLLVAAVLGALLTAPVEGRVRIVTKPDGTKVIYDESSRFGRGSASSQLAAPKGTIADMIDLYARDRGLSPRLVQAVIQVESAYNPRARSSKGAMGLMQLMPDTARQLRVPDPYDPAQNIRGGTLYLRRQLDRFSGDLSLALAAYNAGPGAVAQYGGVPPYPETRNYVRKVLSLYRGGNASEALREQARDESRNRARVARNTSQRSPGSKVYMSRGKNNRIVFTTARPRPSTGSPSGRPAN